MVRGRSEQRIKGWLQLGVVIILVAGAFLFADYLAELDQASVTTPETGERAALVETVAVTPERKAITFTSTGTVHARTMVNISPQVGGKVVKLFDRALPGGTFKADQPLFQIEKDDFQLAIERRKGDVERARTQFYLAEADAAAAQAEWATLHPDREIPLLAAKKPQKRQAWAELEAAKADLKQAKLDLERTTYSLPFDGRVMTSELEDGQVVTAGQSYGRAYSMDALEVRVRLGERETDWLREAGRNTRIVVLAEDDNGEARRYRAKIKRYSADLDDTTRFGAVMLGFKQKRVDLLPGRFITARFRGPEREDVWAVPLNVLQDNNTLLKVESDNRITRLKPEILHIGEDRALVKGTGKPVTLVKGSLRGATKGMKVRVRDEGEGDVKSN